MQALKGSIILEVLCHCPGESITVEGKNLPLGEELRIQVEIGKKCNMASAISVGYHLPVRIIDINRVMLRMTNEMVQLSIKSTRQFQDEK